VGWQRPRRRGNDCHNTKRLYWRCHRAGLLRPLWTTYMSSKWTGKKSPITRRLRESLYKRTTP
jgi:hypothetical protein